MSKPTTVAPATTTTSPSTTTTTSTTTITTAKPTQNYSYRLPPNLRPYKYRVNVNLQNLTLYAPLEIYTGITEIFFTCVADTNKIILNMQNIVVKKESLQITSDDDPEWEEQYAFEYKHDVEKQLFIAEFDNATFRANYSYYIRIENQGFLRTDNFGFYRSTYTYADGTKKVINSIFKMLKFQIKIFI